MRSLIFRLIRFDEPTYLPCVATIAATRKWTSTVFFQYMIISAIIFSVSMYFSCWWRRRYTGGDDTWIRTVDIIWRFLGYQKKRIFQSVFFSTETELVDNSGKIKSRFYHDKMCVVSAIDAILHPSSETRHSYSRQILVCETMNPTYSVNACWNSTRRDVCFELNTKLFYRS